MCFFGQTTHWQKARGGGCFVFFCWIFWWLPLLFWSGILLAYGICVFEDLPDQQKKWILKASRPSPSFSIPKPEAFCMTFDAFHTLHHLQTTTAFGWSPRVSWANIWKLESTSDTRQLKKTCFLGESEAFLRKQVRQMSAGGDQCLLWATEKRKSKASEATFLLFTTESYCWWKKSG